MAITFIENYTIGDMHIAIDKDYCVWYNGCRICGEQTSVQEARKVVFTYIKAQLSAQLNGLASKLQTYGDLNAQLHEEFDLRIFKKSS